MLRRLAVHLTGIAVLIAMTAFGLHVGRDAPVLNRDLVVATTGAYALIWLILLTPSVGPDPAARLRRRRNVRLIGLGGALAIIISSWLIGPYVDEADRLVAIVFQMGAVSMQVLGSVRRAPDRGRPDLVPVMIPASLGAFYAVHWGPYSAAIIAFAITYGFVTLTLRDALQRAVDRADTAREAAEVALVRVAAERDAKTRFLASASHDLGQPLQAARLFFDQAMRGRDAKRRQAAAQRVTWALDSTEQLLRQMLDHLRLESGAVEAHVAPVAVGPLIARIAEMNEPAARLAGMAVLALPTRLTAFADVALAERVLGNLVANSVRHAKGSRVLVGARRHGDRVRLWVIDDGAGIAPADAEHLFDDYVQGSDHGDEIRGGFGLGLASARRMAGLMGGAVGLDAKWRGGSAFWLELNGAAAKAP